jgi:hypothetical protein
VGGSGRGPWIGALVMAREALWARPLLYNTPMTSNLRRAKGSGRAVLVLGLVLLPVLYVASMGPAYAMMQRDQLGQRRYSTLYRPVILTVKGSSVLKGWYIRYVVWWDRRWPGEQPPAMY